MENTAANHITVKKFTDLSNHERLSLEQFIDKDWGNWLPYHTLAFAKATEEGFGYENLSLVALDQRNQVKGYLPQWRRGRLIESVPWRDKGGPLSAGGQVVQNFVAETEKLVKELGLKGFLWKDFPSDLLRSYKYYVNVDIDLTRFTAESFWQSVSNKVRGKIRSAQRNGLRVEVEQDDIKTAICKFYHLFVVNRRRLGVPVYPYELFDAYTRYMPRDKMKIFSVYLRDTVIASLILFHNSRRAIDAYSASNVAALEMKANDLLIFTVIAFCIENGIQNYDFGADSPLQTSLITYKLKWLGEEREIATSYFGDVRETDHNHPRYSTIRWAVRRMPPPLYGWFSRIVVR